MSIYLGSLTGLQLVWCWHGRGVARAVAQSAPAAAVAHAEFIYLKLCALVPRPYVMLFRGRMLERSHSPADNLIA